MEKQKLIEKWENKTSAPSCEISAPSIRPSEYEMYTVGYGVARVEIIEDLKRLDKPQDEKVEVPDFVAEWIELCKEKADLSSCLNGYYEIGDGTIVRPRGFSEEFYDWLSDYDHMHDLARAYLEGYEVEEEPKWKIINDQKYCLTSIEAGYGNSLHWAFDSTKKKPILFDNEETALYTAYITGGTVEKV